MVCLSRLVLAVVVLWGGEAALAGPPAAPSNLARFEPSPVEVAERMLQLANVTRDDVVFDLGSGDGRIVILAARRYGARGVGVEIDPQLVWFSRQDAQRHQVDHLVTFVNADALTVDVSPATVVTLFLTAHANLFLRSKLLSQLRPGARVVSHWHDMGDWRPATVEHVTPSGEQARPVYLWIVPPRKE